MSEEIEPQTKRRKSYSTGEILEKLKECENDVKKVVSVIVSDLTPFDEANESMTAFEDRLERMKKLSTTLACKYINKRIPSKKGNSSTNQSCLKKVLSLAVSIVSFSLKTLRSCHNISVRPLSRMRQNTWILTGENL